MPAQSNEWKATEPAEGNKDNMCLRTHVAYQTVATLQRDPYSYDCG